MISRIAKIRLSLLSALLFSAAAYGTEGPTIRLDYGSGTPPDNTISQFMYFVPLISPEPVTVYTNEHNTQCARIISLERQTNGDTFTASCKFAFTGSGEQVNVFDYSEKIQRRKKAIRDGQPLRHQLRAIKVSGTGKGTVEIAGIVSNGLPIINVVELHFNRDDEISPVTIDLYDLVYRDGGLHYENEAQARVNSLLFRRMSSSPKMEISLASIKNRGAGDGLWQNFLGNLRGATANLFLPPLKVAPEGQQAMLDFGLALASGKSEFTFPLAKRLKPNPPVK